MFSGQYTHHCHSYNNHKGLEPGTPTFKTRMADAGWTFATDLGGYGKHDYLSGAHTHLARVTAWTGNADIQLPVYPNAAPVIHDNTDERCHTGDWHVTDQGCAFLREHAHDDAPFFLYLGIGAPHPSFVTNRRHWDMIDHDAVEPLLDDINDDHPVMAYQRLVKNWEHGFSPEMVAKVRGVYYAMCAEVDAQIGLLRDTINELGLAENTIFIFGSDHGELALEHRQWYKMSMYEGSVRVPLIMAGPGITADNRVSQFASLVDLYPTFMDIAGLAHPADLDGQSLYPALTGTGTLARDHAYACFTGTTLNTTAWMIRTDDWKYIAYPGYDPQLFNLATDPNELQNVAAQHPDQVRRLDAALREIVDYPAAHARVMAYNKIAFAQWRQQARTGAFRTTEYRATHPLITYEDIMANMYVGFCDKHDQQLDAWLAS